MARRSKHLSGLQPDTLRRPSGSSRGRRRSTDPFVLALVPLALFKILLVRSVVLGGVLPGIAGLWLELAAVAVLVGVAALLGRKGRLPALTAYTVFSVVCLLNVMYSMYFRQAFDLALMGLAGQTFALGDTIRELLRPWHIVFVLDLPVLWFIAYGSRSERPHTRRWVGVVTAISVLVLALQVGLAVRASDGVEVTVVAGSHGVIPAQTASLVSALWGGGQVASGGGAAAVAEFSEGLGPYDPRKPGKRLAPFGAGVARGKNVVIIEWESLQGFAVNGRVDGREVTPHLNRFAKEAWVFPNSYSQTGAGNTSDAEFVANTGLLGPLTQPASVAYTDRKLPGLPRILAQQAGYTSYTMHTNAAKFWNRRELYPALGFTGYYDSAYFKDRDKMWRGSSDEVLFEEAAKILAEKTAASERPVLLEILTMTSHMPFNFPKGEERRPLKVTPQQGETMAGRYVGSLSFTDEQLGRFIADLKAKGLYDDTVIVVFGDHTGYQNAFPEAEDGTVLSQLLGGRGYGEVDRQRVPILVRVPGEKGRVVSSVRSQADIMPTVAALLGLDLRAYPHVGRDVFDDGERLVPFRYYYPAGTYATSRSLVIPGLSGVATQAFSLDKGSAVELSAEDRAAREYVRAMNRLSEEWLRSQPVRPDARDLGDAVIPGGDK